MTSERYDLLLVLMQELKDAINEVKVEEGVSPHLDFDQRATVNIEVEQTYVCLSGDEPWQYGEPISSYIGREFICSDTRTAAVEKRRIEGEALLAAKQKRDAEEAERQRQEQTERDLKTLQELRTKYPDA